MLRQASRDRGFLDGWVIPLPDWSEAKLPGLRGTGWEMPLIRYLDDHPRVGGGRGGPDGAAQFEFTWQSSAQGHGSKPPKGTAPSQVAEQDSRFEASGHPDFAYQVGGRLGGIRDIDIGRDAGEVVQINALWQSASGAAGGKGGVLAVPQTAEQDNWLRAAGDANFFLHVEGNAGSIRGIDVGLIAGHVVQANLAGQWATATGAAGKKTGGGAPDIEQVVAQANWLEATGEVDSTLHIEGNVGSIRDIDVGLVAGSIVQANAAWQAASSPAGKGAAINSIDQIVQQENRLQASGDIDFTLVVEGNVGAIYDIEVGLVAGEILEVNAAAQRALNAGGKGAGAAPQTIEQIALQQDLILALGEVDVTLVVEGAFHESIHDITFGLVAAEIVQANLAQQQGTNVGGGGVAQSIVQFITQSNVIDTGGGGLDVTVTIGAGFTGPIAGIEIGLVVGEITQTNDAVQIAINAGDGWCLLG
jgi:hypothetical protein